MSDRNPWLSSSTEERAVLGVPTTPGPSLPRPTGPTAPQAGVTAPDLVDQLPMREHPSSAHLWVVGVHGGAGAATLAGLIPGGRPGAHAWPRPPARPVPTRVLLVTRSNAAGLEAGRKAVTHWASGALGDIALVGLVIVADAPGRLPKPLRQLADLVAGAPPRTWRMPWVQAWRLGEDVDLDTSPREVQRIVTEISSLL